MNNLYDLEKYAQRANGVCIKRGWGRDWREGGCYLHLEVSEFIEALRGKGDPEDESADVLFVFLAMLAAHGVDIPLVMSTLRNKCGGAK